MKQTRKLKRTYSLGNYKNLVVENSFDDIPKDVWRESETSKLIDLILLNSVELAYRRYLALVKNLPMEPEEAVAILVDRQDEMSRRLIEFLNGDVVDMEVEDVKENEK